MRRIFLGITGASGSLYGIRLLRELASRSDIDLHFAITDDGLTNVRLETGMDCASVASLTHALGIDGVHLHDISDFAAPVASGSFMVDDYIIAPASMGFVGRAAGGISSNLIERCADVALKEYRNLVVLFREMPLSAIHLENLLTLSRAGAKILPAAPGFYHNPQSIDELVDFVAGKVLDTIRIPHTLFTRWGS